MPIIEERASKDSTIFTDSFKSYDGLVDYSYKQHYRVIHSNNEFVWQENHINGTDIGCFMCFATTPATLQNITSSFKELAKGNHPP